MHHDSWTPSAPEIKQPRQPAIRAANLGPEYNKFLFATAAEANGNAVTVLSALARQDLDPWTEAAALARMPSALAIQRLTRLLEPAGIAPAGSVAAQAQSRRTATKLIALLPCAGFADIPSQLATGGPAIANARSILIFLLIFMGVMLSIQCIAHFAHAPHQPGPARTGQLWAGHAK
jgi:hypothetical protein